MLLSLKITLQRYVIRLRQKSFEYSLSKPTVKFATFWKWSKSDTCTEIHVSFKIFYTFSECNRRFLKKDSLNES